MRPWIILVSLAGVLTLCSSGRAQEGRLTQSGIVTEDQLGRPIGGATVTAVGDKGASPTTTDSDGRFVITLASGVRLGSVIRVRIEKPGFEPRDEFVSVNPAIPLPVTLRAGKPVRSGPKSSSSGQPAGIQRGDANKESDQASSNGPMPPPFKFHEDVPSEYYTIIMGAMSLRLAREMLIKGWNGLAVIDGERPFRIYQEGNDIYVDAEVYDQHGDLVLRLEKSLIKSSLPPKWDTNYSDSAMEVVDADQDPIFQMVRAHPGTLILNGKWYGKAGSFFGTAGNLKPIFRYPYWKYPHQYADQ